MSLADNLERHKISDKFKFGPDQTIDFGVTCPLVQKKIHIPPCLEYNQDRHKISDEFEFRPDPTIDWSYLPFSAEIPHIIHVNPPGSSGSLPEMRPNSRTPGSETEPPGCENSKKFFFFQTIIFAHMYGNNGHLLLEGN